MTLLTELEAAEMAKVCPRTIRRLIEGGKLRAANYGNGRKKLYRIRPEDMADVQPFEMPAPHERVRRHRSVRSADKVFWPPSAVA
jgi:hypothetical protein